MEFLVCISMTQEMSLEASYNRNHHLIDTVQHLIKSDINVQQSQFGKDFQILVPLKMDGCTIPWKNLIVPNRLQNIRLIISRKWRESPQSIHRFSQLYHFLVVH